MLKTVVNKGKSEVMDRGGREGGGNNKGSRNTDTKSGGKRQGMKRKTRPRQTPKRKVESNDVALDCAIQLASMSQETNEGGSGANTDAADQSKWSEVKKDRNRLNAKKSRDRQQQEIDTLESQNMRLAVSNDALRFQNGHLRDAILRIKKEHDGVNETGQGQQAFFSANQISQSAAPHFTQQQFAALLLANEATKGDVARSLHQQQSCTAPSPLQTSHGSQDLARLLRYATSSQIASPPSSQFLTSVGSNIRNTTEQYCCAEYQLFCAMRGNPNIQNLNNQQRRQHHSQCPNNIHG